MENDNVRGKARCEKRGSSNTEARKKRGEIELGGCIVSEGMPTDHCKDCGADFGHGNLQATFREG